MGSGSSRRKKDKPIIRKPKGTKGGAGNSEKAAEQCLPSFEVNLEEHRGNVEGGDRLELQKKGERYDIIHLNQPIHTISSTKSEMVDKCDDLGITYQGEVVEKSDTIYGQFLRM
jgi:hypothetical protein